MLLHMEVRNVEISALRTLRSGFLYLLIAMIVGIVAVSVGLVSIPHGASAFAGAIGAAAALLILLLVAVGIALYAVFGKIRPGMRRLSEVDSRFRICYTGTTLMLVGLVITVLGLIGVAAVFAAAGSSKSAVIGGFALFGVLLIGGVIAFIGDILTFVVGAFKLHNRYQNFLYMAAGILFVADFALLLVGFSGILTLVGYVLMYMALGGTINKLSAAAATPAQA